MHLISMVRPGRFADDYWDEAKPAPSACYFYGEAIVGALVERPSDIGTIVVVSPGHDRYADEFVIDWHHGPIGLARRQDIAGA